MVGRLNAAFKHADPDTCVVRSFCKHLGKQAFADMVRAGTSNKDAARSQQPHGSVVDFLVSAHCAFKALPVFCKGGRVENDRVVTGAFPVALAKKIECI